jgi:D-alanyl-D-alanine carboxypeptidase/D-alanyl-D-alanine-endopeptidase (penicillin-binding protein 4)
LDNRLTVVAQGDCANWEDAVSPQLNGAMLSIQGTFPTACGERAEYVSLLPHSSYLNAVFRALWQELGGTFSGELREGAVPPSATLFAIHSSAPLSELIRDINKFSNNVMARQLFLSLGMSSAVPASIAHSEQAVHDWLAQKQLDFPELTLENGAGLSRAERISARSMALLLQAAQGSPLQPEFEASLPIIGVDGTLKKRLHESAASYVQSRSGKQWVMVFFINHANASAGQRAQDALIEWVQQR